MNIHSAKRKKFFDGKQMADLRIDFGVGVSASATYVVKRIDSDYFEES